MINLTPEEIINPHSIYYHTGFSYLSNSMVVDLSLAHKVALQDSNNRPGTYAQPSVASQGPYIRVSHKKSMQIH